MRKVNNKRIVRIAKPIGRRVLLLPIKEKIEQMTAGGIYLAGSQVVEQNFGEVIEVGSKVEFVKKGDVVLYGNYGNEELLLDNVKYLLCTEDNFYCTISEH